jgi:hypothetical protein
VKPLIVVIVVIVAFWRQVSQMNFNLQLGTSDIDIMSCT